MARISSSERNRWDSRDIRSSAIGFADRSTNENTFSNASALVRRPKFKIQDVDTLHAQSDYTNKFRTGSIEHTITTGVDFGREEKDVYAPLSTGSKPGTTIGTPADGAWINEDGRPLYHSSHYRSNAFGAYVQARVAQALAAAGQPAQRLVLVGTAAGFVEGARQYDVQAVAADTLVIHGAVDTTVPLANVLAWAEPLDLPVVVVPGADHFFHRRLHVIRDIVTRAWRH